MLADDTQQWVDQVEPEVRGGLWEMFRLPPSAPAVTRAGARSDWQ